jgi:hypothetical protein
MSVYTRRSRRPAATSRKEQPQHNGVAGWKRRHEASCRVVSLDCGCGPDPWLCRCTTPPLSEKMIDAGRDAALHILDRTERVPLLEVEVLQALWRRGGADRELAELLHQLTSGQIA